MTAYIEKPVHPSMNHNPPSYELVVSVYVPQCVWAGNFVVSSIDRFLASYSMPKRINSSDRGFDAWYLKTKTVLSKKSNQVLVRDVRIRVSDLVPAKIIPQRMSMHPNEVGQLGQRDISLRSHGSFEKRCADHFPRWTSFARSNLGNRLHCSY
ncbi:hypothetical protein BC629DRAFT_465336 [Irpex lacteus]|nr:hypothetical protein BC629DRAFT_465336 [Irpex lacteus]